MSPGRSKPLPFHGEGYRKAWAKTCGSRGCAPFEGAGAPVDARATTSKPRLRAGHAHGPKAHDGTITTEAPDVMWGTDMTATVTVAEGAAVVLRGRRSLRRPHASGSMPPSAGPASKGPGADPPGHPRTLRGHRRRRGPWAAAASRPPRSERLGRRFSYRRSRSSASKASPSFVREPEGNGVRGALHPHAEGESVVGADAVRDDRRSSAWPCSSSSGSVQRAVDAGEIRLSKPRPGATCRPPTAWTLGGVEANHRQTTVQEP